MNTSKLWSALVLSCIACGSSFHSSDASTDPNDGGSTSSGGDLGSGGDVASGGSGNAGKAGKGGGSGHAGSASSGGSTSSGGGVSVGGRLGIGGDIGFAGGNSSGGVIGISGSTSSGGVAGSNMAGAGGTGAGGADCSTTGKLWTSYMDLVTKAQLCDPSVAGECVANSNIVTQGNCPIPVNQKDTHYDAARKALDSWKAAGCTFKISMCLAQPSPLCQLDPNMVATCVSSAIIKN